MELSCLKDKVIISVQAAYGEPLYEESALTAMMQSVVNGGAQGLRVAGERDVKNAKKLFDIPVIGITKPKVLPENWLDLVYITPTLEDVNMLISAGADIIAFDGTSLAIMLKEIRNAYEGKELYEEKTSMFDLSTYEEALKKSEKYENAKKYYESIFDGLEIANDFPEDFEDNHLLTQDTLPVDFKLDEEKLAELFGMVKKNN